MNIQAFATGNPVVAVKASGVEDIVKNGCNGYMAELTASGFRASALAVYEESLYVQCIKREAEREYGNETNWTGNFSTLIYRLFKAS